MLITASTVAVAIIAMYLVDCVLLIERGQGIFALNGSSAQFGTRNYVLGGRPIVVLNPLTPWRLAVKSRSILSDGSAHQIHMRHIAALQAIAILGSVQALLVLFVGPLSLHFMSWWFLMGAVIVAYLLTVAMGISLWASRHSLGLSTHAYFNIIMGALFCAPLSINMARKAALISTSKFEAMAIICHHGPSENRDDARQALLGQLEEACLEAEDGSSRSDRVHGLLTALQRRISDVRT